ncbi:recombination-related endonuclease [Xanthomonas phage XaC1]|nr:recombination-related endonuclease [Xanthomonas phage XaC1]
MALFNKAITFTDMHLGLRNNSKQHNEDCVAFTEFMIEHAKERDIKTCIFMGDFFHNRSNINVNTLNYGLKVLELLNDNFDIVYFIVGNHDMYHKNKRDVASTNIADKFPNIKLINDIETFDDCTFIPFMIDNEYEVLPTLKSKYVFGHLELPGYLLNKMIEMPDHGKETEESFKGCEYVFSGHFHKRQTKITNSGTNVIYTGNCFPHNYSDAWDDARGVMILEHGKTPEFIAWDDAPKYRTFSLSELLTEPDFYLQKNTISKVLVDINVSMDEISFIRETFSTLFEVREFNVIPNKKNMSEFEDVDGEVGTETVDEIVIKQINNMDLNDSFKKELLIQIYLSL